VAISLVVKSEGINYVAALYIAWLLAVKSVCPEEFQNAAVFLAVVEFDALWSALSKVVKISGVDPKLQTSTSRRLSLSTYNSDLCHKPRLFSGNVQQL